MTTHQIQLNKIYTATLEDTFVEGHVLTAVEAIALNNARAQSARAAFIPRLAKLLKTGTEVENINAIFTEFCNNYVLKSRVAVKSGNPINAIRAIALDIAVQRVKAQLKLNHVPYRTVKKAAILSKAEELVNDEPLYMVEAEKRYLTISELNAVDITSMQIAA